MSEFHGASHAELPVGRLAFLAFSAHHVPSDSRPFILRSARVSFRPRTR